MSHNIAIPIPPYTEDKIRKYLDLWKALETRELSPEERIEGVELMQQASQELFIQALFTVNHRRLNGS